MADTTFKFKRGASGGSSPSGLTHGELAVNTTDNRLFVGSVTGSVNAVNTKFFSEDVIPNTTFQGDRWFTGGSEFSWVNGTNGGYWIELGNQFSSVPKQSAFLTVKDFGAKGDGTTDDTLSIQNALTTIVNSTGSLTSDKFLLFPPGTYLISPSNNTSGTNRYDQCLFTRLPASKGSLKLVGNNATLVCTGDSSSGGLTHASHMLWIQAGGNDINIDGLNFEGNNKSVYGLKIQETVSPYQASVNISNCKFRNMYIPASNPFLSLSFNETTGVFVYGSYNNVIIDKCLFQNITRAKIESAAGSSGLVLSGEVINGKHQATKTATISSCYFENISSGETSAYGSTANIDCDALKFFGGNVSGTDYIDCRASIYGNHFVNCRGRDIKVQADEATIQANTSSTNILPITNGFARINCQISSGIVSNNVFHFDPVTGASWMSPFIENGGLTAGSSVISFYDGVGDSRNRSITVTDNHVFNNVPQSVGTLSDFFHSTEGDSVARPSGFITIQGNKIVGKGACLRFANIAGRSSIQNPIYYTISDNMISTITGGNVGQTAAFLGMQNSSFNNTILHVHGNVQSGTKSVPHAINTSDQNVIAPANINAYSNWGIGLSASTQRADGGAFIPRIGMMADPYNAEGGVIAVQSVTLANDQVYTFPYKGQLGYGSIRMLCVAYDYTTNYMFVHGGTSLIDIYKGSDIVKGGTANPGVVGLTAVNVWASDYAYGTSTVSIQNRLGGTYVFNLYTFG